LGHFPRLDFMGSHRFYHLGNMVDIMKQCKCGKMIDFVPTISGGYMPIEPETEIPVMVKDKKSGKYFLQLGFVAHWANCPYSPEFKKKDK